MFPTADQLLSARSEIGLIGITRDRKYYRTGGSVVKRSLRQSEFRTDPSTGAICVLPFNHERILNEAACLEFIAENTNIPVPKLLSCFEDNKSAYIITEVIEGVQMSTLCDEKRRVVEKELEIHLDTLRNLRSNTWGGPTGLVIPPYRVMRKAYHPVWRMKPRALRDLVFCHNNLSTNQVVVDPNTLKINGICDWEHAGFFFPEFEGQFFRRLGPPVALHGEVNDEQRLLDIMKISSHI